MTSSERSSRPRQPCVVIVEDNVCLRQVLALGLKTAGLAVREAGSEIELHRTLRHAEPAALVIDLQRSEADGLQLVEHLRSRASLRGVPVVFVAGTDDEAFRQQALRAGADWLCPRPIGVVELQRWLAALIHAANRAAPRARHKRVS